MKRVIELDMETEKTLTSICDAALKQGGMQLYGSVAQLIANIKQQEDVK
jgi:hypothetical protein